MAIDTGVTPLSSRPLCALEDFGLTDTWIESFLPAGQVALASVFPA